MNSIQVEHFTKALFVLLDETFDNVHGYYLDKNTSLFQYLRQLWAGGGVKNCVNSAQTGNLQEDFGQ